MNQSRPYIGLRPYEFKNRENFFGRDADCEILVDKLLANCLVDDLSSQQHQQVQLPHVNDTEKERYVEPAYLQIVCEYLWEKNQNDQEKTLRLATYEKAGAANGIVQRFLETVQRGFSTSEKDLVSKAFDYLAAQGGVKMAYPAKVLANILKVDENKLARVLDKLSGEDVRVLRKQTRDGTPWYELYHDMFSPSIERWNNDWKTKRLRKQRWISGSLGAVLLAGSAILVDSFMWIQKNNFPASELFTEQRYRLMNWGLIKPAIPKMVEIPMAKGGEKMGELNQEWWDNNIKGGREEANYGNPVVNITVEKPFSIGQFEVSYEQYDYYVWKQLKSGVEKALIYPTGAPRDNGRGNRAVTQVSWSEAGAYTRWLTEQSEEYNYRLPTEAEWEYAARAGTRSAYWWDEEMKDGTKFSKSLVKANCRDCGSKWDNLLVAPIGSFKPNQFGLYDTAGNVLEWTCSEFSEHFEGKEQVCAKSDLWTGTVRGGSWSTKSLYLRSSSRVAYNTDFRSREVGFRIVGIARTK